MTVLSLAERVAQVWPDAAITGGSGVDLLLALMDEFVVILGRQQATIGQQQAEIVHLREQNRDLRRQLDRRSGNSS